MNLFFTGKCNLNCRYCFVDKENQGNLTLSEASIKKSIDTLFSFPGKRKSMTFVGGEPMMEFNLVKKTYDYALALAKKKKVLLDVIVSTNGTKLDQKSLDYFSKNSAILKISIDGNKKTHDKNRPFKNMHGKSSFDSVMSNLKKIDFKNLKVTASLVFTPDSLGKLVENIKFLNSKNFYSIEFYPDFYASWKESDLQKMKKVFHQFEMYYESLFKGNGRVFKNFQIDAVFNNLEFRRREQCGKINVDAEGNFYVCDKVFSLNQRDRKRYAVGNTKKGIDNKKRVGLIDKINKSFFKKAGLGCEKCLLLKHCFCLTGHFIYFSNLKKDKQDADFWKNLCFIFKIYYKTSLSIKKALKNNQRFITLYKTDELS